MTTKQLPQTKMKNKPTTETVVTESLSDSDVNEDDGDVLLDEIVSADEDIRPHQKIEVDDKVHSFHTTSATTTFF